MQLLPLSGLWSMSMRLYERSLAQEWEMVERSRATWFGRSEYMMPGFCATVKSMRVHVADRQSCWPSMTSKNVSRLLMSIRRGGARYEACFLFICESLVRVYVQSFWVVWAIG